MRLTAEQTRLAHLEKQVESCRIRAPHDGMVVYLPEWEWRGIPLDAGTEVFQHEELFYLPDMSRLQAEVAIHESVGRKVRVGMTARLHLLAQPQRQLTGKVVSMDMMPREDWRGRQWRRCFFIRIALDETPPGLLPLMSAEVSIDTGTANNALVIPTEATWSSGGQQRCRVIGPDGLEDRPITIGNATPDLVEVTAGLSEGERVVLPLQK